MAKLIYLIQREGEHGHMGKISDAIQVVEGSPIAAKLLAEDSTENYKLGTAEEYAEYTGITAGDVNSDGEVDEKDEEITDEIRDKNADADGGEVADQL
jgi:hypothetical protein